MYRYLVFFVNLWLVSSAEIPEKADDLINHTPVILTKKSGEYHYPKKGGLNKDQNQEYFYSKKQDGRYFCPLEPNDKNKDLRLDIEATKKLELKYCLFMKKYKKGTTPRCEMEPKPVLLEKRDRLGQESCGTGRLYKFVYEICVEKTPIVKLWKKLTSSKAGKDEFFDVQSLQLVDVFSDVQYPHLYEACFDHWSTKNSKTSYRTLFTKHKIRSPYIFRNLILDEENSLHHPDLYQTEPYGFETLKRLANHLKAYNDQSELHSKYSIYLYHLLNKGRFRMHLKYEYSTEEQEAKAIKKAKKEARKSKKPPEHVHTYILQQLVPEDDFALGHWKKPTYHMINYSPMNTLIEPTWRAINLHVYNRLIELYDKFGDVDIFTGTYDEIEENGEIIYLGNDEETGVTIPGLWWKLLYAPSTKNRPDREGIVIVMHAAGNPDPICKESGTACDPKTWGIEFPEEFDNFVYCCKVGTARKYILTIRKLNLGKTDKIKLMDLG